MTKRKFYFKKMSHISKPTNLVEIQTHCGQNVQYHLTYVFFVNHLTIDIILYGFFSEYSDFEVARGARIFVSAHLTFFPRKRMHALARISEYFCISRKERTHGYFFLRHVLPRIFLQARAAWYSSFSRQFLVLRFGFQFNVQFRAHFNGSQFVTHYKYSSLCGSVVKLVAARGLSTEIFC